MFVGAAACQRDAPTENVDSADGEPALNQPMVPRPQPPLDRAALFAAVAQAASAEASGTEDSEAQRTLDGRQFELRIRFGCKGPSPDLRQAWLGWVRDADSGTLRVRAKPTLEADDELVRELGGDDFEAVEGFWIPRAWLLEPACPVGAAVLPSGQKDGGETKSDDKKAGSKTSTAADEKPADPVPNWPRIGIAHFFTETEPRTVRRSTRPYEAVKTIDPKQPLGSQGFNLVLSGRLQALPDGRVIACVAKSPDNAPECVVSAQFDRVRIEQPENGEIIAEWGGG
jgi:hypothetical protein